MTAGAGGASAGAGGATAGWWHVSRRRRRWREWLRWLGWWGFGRGWLGRHRRRQRTSGAAGWGGAGGGASAASWLGHGSTAELRLGGASGSGGVSGGTSGGSGGASGSGGVGGSGGSGGGTGGASGSGGDLGGSGGLGGASGGASGSGGSGGATQSALCDKNVWKYTFQFCPHDYVAGDNQPTLAVDGDTATFVTSGAAQDGTFFAVFDLHGAVTVSSLTLDYGAGTKAGDASASLNLQGSDDGVTFTDITGPISGALVANKLTITVPATATHRFLKLLQLGTSGSWWAIPELNITCGAGTPAQHHADAGTASDRTQWQILTPNSACPANGPASNMIDANAASAWQSVGRPGVGYWIRVDLGTTAALKGVHLKNQGSDFPPSVKVQVSSDDITYVDAITGVTGNVDMDMVFPATQNARFFRILSEVDTTGAWWTVTDLNIDL